MIYTPNRKNQTPKSSSKIDSNNVISKSVVKRMKELGLSERTDIKVARAIEKDIKLYEQAELVYKELFQKQTGDIKKEIIRDHEKTRRRL